ncbi:hypothetical protein [Galactobacter sp.]|uniref:hypothetical protein n=1 Tax=Galactobacter sp. TaxID=2676125 RepID=UPI0025C321C7|nr:hypothetical protein [Galactobacter sp.]
MPRPVALAPAHRLRPVPTPLARVLTGSCVALMAASMLASCAKDEPPVVDLAQPPTSLNQLGGRIAVENSATADRAIPSACDLLTDATVKSVFPQAETVSHVASSIDLARPFSDEEPTPIPEAHCTFTIDLPVGSLEKDAGSVEVVIGPRDSVVQDDAFTTGIDDDLVDGTAGLQIRPGSCSNASSSAVQCVSADDLFSFWVKTSLPRHTPSKVSDDDHYRSNGLTERFRSHDKEANELRRTYLGAEVSRPLAMSILSRLDGRERHPQ